jgi:hypothetical protein
MQHVKKTDLEKNKGLKINNQLKQDASLRRGADADKPDRREQRKLDQQQGLIPFACKLNEELVKQLKTQAAEHPGGLNGLVDALLRQALGATPD